MKEPTRPTEAEIIKMMRDNYKMTRSKETPSFKSIERIAKWTMWALLQIKPVNG